MSKKYINKGRTLPYWYTVLGEFPKYYSRKYVKSLVVKWLISEIENDDM